MDYEKNLHSLSKNELSNLIRWQEIDFTIISQEYIDDLKPSVYLMEISQISLQMLMEHHEYIIKNGETEQTIKRKDRALRLLELSNELNMAPHCMNSLKLTNRSLYKEVVFLKQENAKLNQQLKNVQDATEF